MRWECFFYEVLYMILRNVGQHTPGQHVFLFSHITYRKAVIAQIITSVSLAVDCVECGDASRKYKNENVNTARSLETGRIEQVRIFTLLSRTEAIEMLAMFV